MTTRIGFQGGSDLLKAAATIATTTAGPSVVPAVTAGVAAATTTVTTAAVAAAPFVLPVLGVGALIWGIAKLLDD